MILFGYIIPETLILQRKDNYNQQTFLGGNILSTIQFYKHPEMENIHIFTTCQMTQTMTFIIIKDIIHYHPEVIRDKVLILRSDNCQEQYKCKYTFFQMKKLAVDLKINVVWFYGEPGHGRGHDDVMSSSGCKLQLKNEIVTFDSRFERRW